MPLGERPSGHRRPEAACGAGPHAAGPRSVGAGGPVSASAAPSAPRRTASDGDRDEHGVAGASVVIIRHRVEQRRRRHGASRSELRAVQRRPDGGAKPARRRKHNTPVMFSEGQARGLRTLQRRASFQH